MTIHEAKNLKPGDYIHVQDKHNADGSPMRARITSVKTWKTRPLAILIGYKRGLYEYGKFDETELERFHCGDGR